MKIAIVSDPLTEYGGEQRVLEAIHNMYPSAPVYTGLLKLDNLPQQFRTWQYVTPLSPLYRLAEKIPLRSLRLLLLYYYANLNLNEYDVVLSSGTLFAKFAGLTTLSRKIKHIAYIHTPPRFLYGYETASGMRSKALLRLFLLPLDHIIRLFDYKAIQNVTTLVCNSKEVQLRIKRFYGRNSTIINPPVSMGEYHPALDKESTRLDSFFQKKDNLNSYFLIVGRLERYKNVDLAINACNLINVPLLVVGRGGEEEHLRSIAGPTIKFLGFVSDNTLASLYSHAKAFIFPIKDEDFGITPIEAQMFGCPVIAHASGGALETVIPGKTGEFFEELNARAIAQVLKDFDSSKYSKRDMISNARNFSEDVFVKKVGELVEE